VAVGLTIQKEPAAVRVLTAAQGNRMNNERYRTSLDVFGLKDKSLTDLDKAMSERKLRSCQSCLFHEAKSEAAKPGK